MSADPKRSWVTQIRGVEPGEASLNFPRPLGVPYSVHEARVDELAKKWQVVFEIKAVSPECPSCGWHMMANEDGTWTCLHLKCEHYFEPMTRNDMDNAIEDAGVRAQERGLR